MYSSLWSDWNCGGVIRHFLFVFSGLNSIDLITSWLEKAKPAIIITMMNTSILISGEMSLNRAIFSFIKAGKLHRHSTFLLVYQRIKKCEANPIKLYFSFWVHIGFWLYVFDFWPHTLGLHRRLWYVVAWFMQKLIANNNSFCVQQLTQSNFI